MQGEGAVTPEGTVTGQLMIDASSLQTKNAQRDRHLRSDDFFDVERHPNVVVEISDARPAEGRTLIVHGTLEAAGHGLPIELPAQVDGVTAGGVTLRAEMTVDRTRLDMTWSPLGMASKQARLSVHLRFVRVEG
jgi:polyisoprenoid-binding protein YceI